MIRIKKIKESYVESRQLDIEVEEERLKVGSYWNRISPKPDGLLHVSMGLCGDEGGQRGIYNGVPYNERVVLLI